LTDKNILWPEEPFEEDDQVTLAATLERPDGTRLRLWYRLPVAYRQALTSSCDPFVLGFLFTIMKWPEDLYVRGQVSPSLLRNLAVLQEAWAVWRPSKYHAVGIYADVERESTRAGTNEAIMGFSGGGDSAYTAWHHRTGHAGRQQRDIVAGVMIHGYDIPLEAPEVFAQAEENNRIMLASLSMDLIPIATNFRTIGGTWEDSYGSGLASSLALLQGRYNTGVIAAGYDYTSLVFPHGSTPFTDPLLSSDSFQFVHDGAALNKLDKLRQISTWPEAMQHLRVCLDGHSTRNCCRCIKCMKMVLLFRILGLGLPGCFDRDFSDADILRMRVSDLPTIRVLETIARQAQEASITDSWVRAFQWSMKFNRLRLAFSQFGLISDLLRPIYRFFLPPDK
jgi:hypothetical protein